MLRALPLIAFLVVVAGCAATRQSAPGELLSADRLFERVRARDASVQTLRGSGLVTIESPEGSHNGGFEARVRKPDSLCVDLHGPFGVQAGTLFLARDTFFYYNRLEHKAITGKPTGHTLRSMLRLTMRFDEMLNVLTGEFPAAAAGDSLLADSLDRNIYRLRYRSGDELREYDVDSENFLVRGYREFDRDGSLRLSAEASRIRMSDTIPVPRLLRVVFPRERRSLTIVYDNVDLNRPVSCALAIPEHTEVVREE